jgi:hypothetical protein
MIGSRDGLGVFCATAAAVVSTSAAEIGAGS